MKVYEYEQLTWKGYKITMYESPKDGTMVIEIDTPHDQPGEPEARIYLNDFCMHENPPYPGGEK